METIRHQKQHPNKPELIRDYSVPKGWFVDGLTTLRSLGFDDENLLKKLDLRDLPVKLIPNKRKWALLKNKDEALAWHTEIFGP